MCSSFDYGRLSSSNREVSSMCFCRWPIAALTRWFTGSRGCA